MQLASYIQHMYCARLSVHMLSCYMLGAYSSRALFVVTLSPSKFLLSHHPCSLDSRMCQDGPGFPPSSYRNQKFVYKKFVSAKDNLKCCTIAEEGGGSLGTRLIINYIHVYTTPLEHFVVL